MSLQDWQADYTADYTAAEKNIVFQEIQRQLEEKCFESERIVSKM